MKLKEGSNWKMSLYLLKIKIMNIGQKQQPKEIIQLSLEKIGSNFTEEFWNGDKEKEKLKTEYFGIGDLEVSFNDKYLGYSLDLKGSEYYTIYVRDISTQKLITDKIEETSGSITFSLDDKFCFTRNLINFIDQGKFLDIN